MRHPEDDKGVEMFNEDLQVDLERCHVISPAIKMMCEDARDATYARDTDLKVLSRSELTLNSLISLNSKRAEVIHNQF